MPLDLKTEIRIAEVVAEHLRKLHDALREDFKLNETEIVRRIKAALPEEE